jgi:hypothetical protein
VAAHTAGVQAACTYYWCIGGQHIRLVYRLSVYTTGIQAICRYRWHTGHLHIPPVDRPPVHTTGVQAVCVHCWHTGCLYILLVYMQSVYIASAHAIRKYCWCTGSLYILPVHRPSEHTAGVQAVCICWSVLTQHLPTDSVENHEASNTAPLQSQSRILLLHQSDTLYNNGKCSIGVTEYTNTENSMIQKH